jgi:hypothetical protein
MRMRIGWLVALAAMAFAFATVAWAAGPEVDPASVSDGLKAIFKYGKGQRESARASPERSLGSGSAEGMQCRCPRDAHLPDGLSSILNPRNAHPAARPKSKRAIGGPKSRTGITR